MNMLAGLGAQQLNIENSNLARFTMARIATGIRAMRMSPFAADGGKEEALNTSIRGDGQVFREETLERLLEERADSTEETYHVDPEKGLSSRERRSEDENHSFPKL